MRTLTKLYISVLTGFLVIPLCDILLGWLIKVGSIELVTTNKPSSIDLVTPENINRLKGIPIIFSLGTGSMVFIAKNPDSYFASLCNAHGRQWYE